MRLQYVRYYILQGFQGEGIRCGRLDIFWCQKIGREVQIGNLSDKESPMFREDEKLDYLSKGEFEKDETKEVF
jgi:hypothetical protein